MNRRLLVRHADELYLLPSYEGAKKQFLSFLDKIKQHLHEQRYPNEEQYRQELERLTKKANEIRQNFFDEEGDERRHKDLQRGIRHLVHQIVDQHPRVFVVHGRNVNVRDAVTSLLGRLKLDFEVLEDRSNAGTTVIEKFLSCAEECDFAVVLMTADDEGGVREAGTRALRARQNVILELGYFISHLGRKRIIIMQEAGVEMELPSDLNGIVRIHYDQGGGWKRNVLKELDTAGVYLHQPYVRNV